jgi:hypothetical protein
MRALLAALALALGAGPTVAQTARPDAALGFRDDDLAWVLPLLDAEAADNARLHVGAAASAQSLQAAVTRDLPRLVERVRSGEVHALDLLRERSAYAVVPPGATYDARCSAALMEGVGGLTTVAAYTLRGGDYRAAMAWYRAEGFSVGESSGLVRAQAPDNRAEADIRVRNPAPHLVRTPGMGHMEGCARLGDGPLLTVEVEGALDAIADAADAAAVAGTAEQLPGALRRAGLTAEAWSAIRDALVSVSVDVAYEEGGMLDVVAGSPAEAARRRADVAWYRRHRAALDARFHALFNP